MNLLIVDQDGLTFTSIAAFPCVDPISGTRFEPGQPVKIKPNRWIASQPALVKAEDLKPTKVLK